MKEIHYRIPFMDANNKPHCIYIYAEGMPDEVKTLKGGNVWDGLMETTEAYSDSKFDTLRFQTGTIHLANEDEDLGLYDIMPIHALDCPVVLVSMPETEEEKVEWQGFLSTEGYTQQYTDRVQIVDFNIKSVLKALEDQPVPDDFRVRHGELELSVGEMIKAVVDETLEANGCPFEVKNWHYPAENRYFEDCCVMMGVFYEEKEGISEDGSKIKKLGGKTIGQMIEICCLYACVAVREYGQDVYMQPLSENGNMKDMRQETRDMRSMVYKSEDNTVKTDYPYKDLTLNIRPIKRATDIEFPDEDDIVFGGDGEYKTYFSSGDIRQISKSKVSMIKDANMTLDILDDYAYDPLIQEGIGMKIKNWDGACIPDDYAAAKGGLGLATAVYPDRKYACARLMKYRLREEYPENYDYHYGLGVIPYSKALLGQQIGGTAVNPIFDIYWVHYKDEVLARISQPECVGYEDVEVKIGGENVMRSVINLQGEFHAFHYDNSDDHIYEYQEDDHWKLVMVLYVENQFGERRYAVGDSTNPIWQEERDVFKLHMYGSKIEDNYNKVIHHFNKTDGYLLPFEKTSETEKVKVGIELITTCVESNDKGYIFSLHIKDYKIKAVENVDDMKKMSSAASGSASGSTSGTGRKIFGLLGGVEDHKNVDVHICVHYQGGDNTHISGLYERRRRQEGGYDIVPAYRIEYKTQSGMLKWATPERELFNRMKAHWSMPRRQFDFTVDSIDAPLTKLVYTGYDGRKYLPLCEKRDWGTGLSRITFFETERVVNDLLPNDTPIRDTDMA